MNKYILMLDDTNGVNIANVCYWIDDYPGIMIVYRSGTTQRLSTINGEKFLRRMKEIESGRTDYENV